MDDPDEDRENEGQTTLKYLEDGGGCKGNMKWILEKGLNLGKKAVITGVVISSAPVVLPQILVVSAVGFAFSVPLGLAYTGYACTMNFMSKLLPMPAEFPMLEYDKIFGDEADGREGKYRIESRGYMEEEEEEQMDDLRAGVEERIELVKNENEVPQEEVEDSEGSSGLKEQGYEEDDDQPLVDKDESSVEMVALADVGQDESVNQERKREKLLPEEDALEPSDKTNFREMEGECGVTELKVEVEGEGDMGTEESSENWNDGMEREVVEFKIEETRPVIKDTKDEEVKPEVERNVDMISGEHGGGNVSVKKENIEVVATVVVGERSKNLTVVENEDEDIKRGSVALLEKIKDEGNADDSVKKTKNKKKKNKKKTSEESTEMSLPDVKDQTMIPKNVIENQKSGPEKRNKLEDVSEVIMKQQPPPVGAAAGSDDLIPSQENVTSYPLKESNEASDNVGRDSMAIGNVDFVEISVTASRPDATDGDNSSAVDSLLPTEKELVDEKKIWEQIDALRTIVGCKATPHRSSMEEVKALYVFAGVELPASFGNQPDLAELNNRLRFLMSIVGVK